MYTVGHYLSSNTVAMVDVEIPNHARNVTNEKSRLAFMESQPHETRNLEGRVIHERSPMKTKKAWTKTVEQNGIRERFQNVTVGPDKTPPKNIQIPQDDKVLGSCFCLYSFVFNYDDIKLE